MKTPWTAQVPSLPHGPPRRTQRPLAVVGFNRLDHLEQRDRRRRPGEPVAAGPTQVPLDEPGPDEVGHHARQEPLRDVHRGADARDAQPPVAVVGGEREHGPDGIVAAPRQFEAHGRSITRIGRKAFERAAVRGQRPARTPA